MIYSLTELTKFEFDNIEMSELLSLVFASCFRTVSEQKSSLGLEQEKPSHMMQELDLQMDEFNDFCGEFNN